MVARHDREREAWNKLTDNPSRHRMRKFYAASEPASRYMGAVLGHLSGQDVLDCGCGVGNLSRFVAKSGAKEVVGIDISEVAIRVAGKRSTGTRRIRFISMNAESMSFPDDRFVVGSAILHHLDLNRACGEIIRVLRPGGRAVFREPLGHNLFINLYRKLTPDMRTEDERPLTIDDLSEIAGYFTRTKLRYFGFLTLLGVPFRDLPGAVLLFRLLNSIDQLLFLVVPVLRRQAWQVVIDATC